MHTSCDTAGPTPPERAASLHRWTTAAVTAQRTTTALRRRRCISSPRLCTHQWRPRRSPSRARRRRLGPAMRWVSASTIRIHLQITSTKWTADEDELSCYHPPTPTPGHQQTGYWDYQHRECTKKDLGHTCRECRRPFNRIGEPLTERRGARTSSR